MAVKVTFTLDEATIGQLNETARHLAKPKSAVVREAIRDYHAKSTPLPDRLSEAERRRMLRVLDEFLKQPPTRPQHEVDRELRELRAARRSGGRLHPAE
jgi:hypothetical protein